MTGGLVRVDGGAMYLDGEDLSRMAIFRRCRLGVAYLPQEASIFRKLTVAENIQAVLELRDLSPEEIESRRDALMEELHISHLRNNPAISLSGGERRRVEIARALAGDPPLILLDGPFGGVHPSCRVDIQE